MQATATPTLGRLLRLALMAAAVALVAIGAVLPIYQLSQAQAEATLNLTPAASASALSTIDLTDASVTPTGVDGLTVLLTVDAIAPDASPVPWHLKVMTQLGTSIWAIGLGIIAFLLGRIVGNIAGGDPFHEAHARWLSWIGIVILVISAGADTVNYLNALVLTRAIGSPQELSATPYYSLIPVALAAVTLVLAGAFRSGRRIQDDTEGLV